LGQFHRSWQKIRQLSSRQPDFLADVALARSIVRLKNCAQVLNEIPAGRTGLQGKQNGLF
jgi:hypothetical protein